jgi:hypothetical protein
MISFVIVLVEGAPISKAEPAPKIMVVCWAKFMIENFSICIRTIAVQ